MTRSTEKNLLKTINLHSLQPPRDAEGEGMGTGGGSGSARAGVTRLAFSFGLL
jgi:hypothetical protein